MTQNSSEVVLKNTAEAVLVPLKDGISSLNGVYEALIKADIDPVTGQCSNYDYIRQQIVQAHQHLQSSERTASSGLKSLDENLERLIQDEGKLECEMNNTKQTLDNLRTEQGSNERLLKESEGALDLARRNLNSTKQTLQNQQSRKQTAGIITGVGAGLLFIPIFGWIAGCSSNLYKDDDVYSAPTLNLGHDKVKEQSAESKDGPAMIIGGAVELAQAEDAVRLANEQVRKSDNEVKRYEHKVSDYNCKISQIRRDISQKDDKLKQTREEIQKVKKKRESVAEFQKKARSAVQLLGVLSGRASVAEHQTRRFILQEPVMKVMEDVIKATKEITGNELLNNTDILRLIDQMKVNNHCLAAICASENKAGNDY